MKRYFIVFLCPIIFSLLSCAQIPTSEEKKTLPVEKVSGLSAMEAPNLSLTEKVQTLDSPDLKQLVSQWISQNESASFGQVVHTANQLLERFGYPVIYDAVKMFPSPKDRFFILEAGKKKFAVNRHSNTEYGAEACGEILVKIPSKRFHDRTAILVQQGEEYRYPLGQLRRDLLRIFKGKKLHATIPLPEPTEPVGISPDGKSVYLRFPLEEKLASLWFSNLVRNQPDLYGEDPYLILKVNSKEINFEKDIRALSHQEFEPEESSGDTIRWRFLPSPYSVELSTRCNPNGAKP